MLKRFLEMSGNIYPDLVRLFYTNLQFVGNNLDSHVKGVDMEITHEVGTAITGLTKETLVWWKNLTKFNFTEIA